MFKPLEVWSGDIATKLERAESDRVALEIERKARAKLSLVPGLSKSPNLIGAFNSDQSLSEILLAAGYDQNGDNYRHPNSQSGSFSLTIRVDENGVERAHTLSTSDPLYVKGSKSGHDAFSVFTVLFHNGDINAALKDAGDNWLTIDSMSWNRAKQIEHEKNKALTNQIPLAPFQFIQINKLIDNPINIKWLIKRFIEAGGLNVLAAPYGTYKTFLVLEMGFCVAAGIDWYGNKVMQCPVIIICGEGLAGIADRVAALCVKYGIPCPDCLYISPVPAQLTDTANADLVGKAVNELCPDAGLVVVDTLNRNFGGLDENSTKDMTAFISNLDRIFRTARKTVIVVHHTGHSNGERGRGSIVLPSSCEGEFILKKQHACVVLTCIKQKNAAIPEPVQFGLKQVTLPDRFDEEDQPVQSLVLEYKGIALQDITILKATDQNILSCLRNAIEVHGIDPPADIKIESNEPEEYSHPDDYKVVLVSHWRSFAFEVIKVSSKSKDNGAEAKRKAFERSKSVLLEGDHIEISGEYVWVKN